MQRGSALLRGGARCRLLCWYYRSHHVVHRLQSVPLGRQHAECKLGWTHECVSWFHNGVRAGDYHDWVADLRWARRGSFRWCVVCRWEPLHAGTQLVSGEITHTAKKAGSGGVVRFSFLWTAPSAPGTFELRAWGNAVNGNGSSSGDRAAFVSLSVNTGPTPTPTATSTATPTPTATPLSHDAVLLPVAPRNIRIPAGATAPVTKKFAVRVRNVDAKGTAAQNFTVSIVGTTCPSGVVFTGPDFDPKTAGVQSTITLNPQQTKPAVVEVSVDRTTITSLKPNLPFRCVVELHADADVMGNTDPSPSNNNVPVELNFFDLGDPAQATPGEAWLARAPATTMVIPSAQVTKTLKKPVVVANGDTMEAALGVNVDLSACPWLTALVDMVPKTAVTEPNVNVAPEKTKAGAIAWSADGSLVKPRTHKRPSAVLRR
jgi:hypothetical protein